MSDTVMESDTVMADTEVADTVVASETEVDDVLGDLCNVMQGSHVWDPDTNFHDLKDAYQKTLWSLQSRDPESQRAVLRSHVQRYKTYLRLYGFPDLPAIGNKVEKFLKDLQVMTTVDALQESERIDRTILEVVDSYCV